MRPVSEEMCNNILVLVDKGLSARAIAKQVGVSRTTVNRVRAKYSLSEKKNQAGRPAKLKVTDKRHMARMITSGKVNTAAQLARDLRQSGTVECSPQTVRRALKEIGLKAMVRQKKPLLAPRHMRQRLEFGTRYESWTVEDWKRIVWSDETRINRLGSDGRQWGWRDPNQGLQAHNFKNTLKFGGGNLMLRGCMTHQGVGFACRIEGHMDAELYTPILQDEFLRTVEYYGRDRGQLIFQQDNDPKHASRKAKEWFETNDIRVLMWPAQSPDLNPIEHLWQYLKRQLNAYETESKGILELWERVEAEWNKIPAQVCLDLVESMPRRVHAVLQAKGGHTGY